MPDSISVVIPTFNGEAWIAETLESVFAQTRAPDEIIVVDDASTDATAGLVAELAAKAPLPVRLIRRDTNSGSPAPTLNTGIAAAAGEVIAVLDQDDVFLPTKLERQASVLSADPGLSFVFALYGDHEHDGRDSGHAGALSRTRRIRRRMTAVGDYLRCDGPAAFEEFARTPINFFGGFPGFLFRRSAWEAKGGFDENLAVAIDFEFLCWLCTQGAVALIPEIHYSKRKHGANLTLSSGIRWRLDVIKVLAGYAEFRGLPGTPNVIADAVTHHLWAISRRLASGGHRQAARHVRAVVSRMGGGRTDRALQRVAILAYVLYYRLLRRPWQISAEQASEATELATRVARQLG